MHDPTEHVQEHVQHTAAHGDHNEHNHGGHASRWITAAALTAALLAALAAISGMLSTSQLTKSTHLRIDSNDQWSYYQSKSIKSSLIDTRIYEAELAHVAPPKKDLAKKAEYEEQLPEIQKRADEDVKLSEKYLESHETFESAETLFHISIAIVAIAVVAKRRAFWYISLIGGAVGILYFGLAFTRIPPAPAEKETATATAPAAPSPEHTANPAHAANETSPPASHPAP
ncbi:MAG TPA: DUF4337 family protein [Phycisphaerae bacterium]|nr:DUF4337 family protein [Phycisphaerae bacterium]